MNVADNFENVRNRGERLGVSLSARRLDEVIAPIALRIEERGQIAMIDARAGHFAQRRLGVEGDAESSRLDHRHIIGAVADRKRTLALQLQALPECEQRVALGVAAEYR